MSPLTLSSHRCAVPKSSHRPQGFIFCFRSPKYSLQLTAFCPFLSVFSSTSYYKPDSQLDPKMFTFEHYFKNTQCREQSGEVGQLLECVLPAQSHLSSYMFPLRQGQRRVIVTGGQTIFVRLGVVQHWNHSVSKLLLQMCISRSIRMFCWQFIDVYMKLDCQIELLILGARC